MNRFDEPPRARAFAIPCPYMVVDETHYVQCKLMPIESPPPNFVLCAWFYDMGDPTIMMEVDVENKSIISDLNFPEKVEEMRKKTLTESDVPQMCPRGFTWKRIDAKIQTLLPRPKVVR